MSRISFGKYVALLLMLVTAGVFTQPTLAQSKKERQRAEQLIREGDRAFDQRNYRTAVTNYAQALGTLPNDGEARFRKGKAHLFLEENGQAAAELDLALKNGQKPLDIARVRWEAYDKLGRYADALADVNRILADDPDNYRFQMAAADLLYRKGDFAKAAEAFAKAIPRSPNPADLYYKIAEAKSKMGDIEGQAAAAEEAIKRNTQFLADALLLLGKARYAQHRIPDAIDAFSRALKSRPDKLESYRQLAELHRSQNQIDEAIKVLEAGRRLNATNGEVYKDLAMFYSLAKRNDDAIAAGTSATQLLPNDPVAYTNLCRAYYQAKRPELAFGACNSALRLSPEDGESLFYIARVSVELGKRSDADKYLKRALTSMEAYTKDKPEDADGFYTLGNVYADLQQNDNALEAYKKAIALNPKLSRAYFNLGVILLIKKDKAGAMEQYDTLLPLDKGLAESLKKTIDNS